MKRIVGNLLARCQHGRQEEEYFVFLVGGDLLYEQHIQGLTEDEANCLVRSDIDGPLGQGFFVAYFIRTDMEDPNIEQLKKFRKEEEPLESQQSEKKVISNPTTKHSHKKVKTNRVKRVSKVAL